MATQATQASSSSQQKLTPTQLNAQNRQLVIANSVEMYQPIQSQTINPAQVNPITFTLRNVGLLRSIPITVTATIVNNDSTNALTLTDYGLSNLFSNIEFTDLSNNQRIKCPSWFITMINTVRHRKPYAAGYVTESNEMMNLGENFPVLKSPTTIAAGATATVRAVFDIPISYSDDDLRGAILMNVINATATLQLTVNSGAFTAGSTDSTFAVYKGTTNAVISSMTVTMYQNYLDQLPRDQTGATVVPALDLQTVYELKTSTVQGMTIGNDYGFQYPNFRDILSTTVIYTSNNLLDTGRSVGDDINYWALQSANFTNIWKKYPLDVVQYARAIINCDLPKGTYHFSSRRKPISSIQYGNMELVVNPIAATANAAEYIGLEMFNQPSYVINAGSIQS